VSRFQKGHKTNIRHGASIGGSTPEYQCWTDIKTRCLKKTSKAYPYYGGRGITICEKWKNDFSAFLADVGERPSPKHTIDRFPDNDGNYEPGNVRWATRAEQIHNRRNTRKVLFQGKNVALSVACKALGLTLKLVTSRIDRGWSPERAISEPARWRR